jgi:radical SAM superfamily enzyme YgiQ (UPF0313 family)
MNNHGRAVLIGAEDEENLAIRYLGAVLKSDGHEVLIQSYTKKTRPREVLKIIKKFHPHLVAISMAFQSLALSYLELGESIKNITPDLHLTVGGHFPTFEYEKLMEYSFIDSIIRFEGEKSLSLLMKAVLNQKSWENIPQLVYRNEGVIQVNSGGCEFPNLENLSEPLRKETPQYRLGAKFSTLISSRGCFHSKCVYCCIGAFHHNKTHKYILRSEESVVCEMEKLYNAGTRLFQFHDDNFLLPCHDKSLERLVALEMSLDQRGIDTNDIAILIKTRPDGLDKHILKHLKSLGVVGIFLGVENASDRGLNNLGRGSNKEEVELALRFIKNYDMAVTFNLLMFHPRANLEEINQNLIFMKEHYEFASDFGRAEIVAGSPLERYVKSQGLLRGEWPSWDYQIKDKNVEKMYRIIALTFYHSESLYPQLSHQSIALAYHAHVVKKLHGGEIADKYAAESLELIKEINKFKIDNFLEVYRLTAIMDNYKEVEELYNYLNLGFQEYLKKINSLSLNMRKYQLMDEEFRSRGLDDMIENSNFLKMFF